MRAVATITVYVYGNNLEELVEEAHKLEKELESKYDNGAKVEKIQQLEFGSLKTKEIIIKKTK